MSDVEQGGPAFPFVLPDEIGGYQMVEPGMTLRDWFAGQAPAAPDGFTIASPECADWQDSDLSREAWSEWEVRRSVAWSWAYADAMLAARKTGAPS